MEVQICSSCLVSSAADVESAQEVQKFVQAVEQGLHERRPEVAWKIFSTSCQRLCPPERVTLVVNAQMMMSKDATLLGVIEQILKIHSKFSGSV